ncbi:Fe3+-hydroxamate ABC transporter substrate-binding protein [Paenibacillus polymyxa]|uniref:ABC transporter substrate-binding protein n=1 Tax=Paenibacillus polymyxa TaxID=1406 RepID=UPI000EB9FC84|nr:ABC transporter substrate-binding protein [Paenibacillus polymyxa]RGL36708.1 Fe3+-hydroxamate ABC transporter substrate-binding protein [Paenibacillus polymyxa]UMR37921.1 ABC transporter substrate-binding protein [Paenibacillus polymyxa]
MYYMMNKKFHMILCALFVMIFVISGCGNAGSSSDSSAQPASSAKEEASSESGTRTVSTIKGDVKVPANPQRVVVNWYIGDVFTLGIKPAAVFGWKQETMPYYDKFNGIPVIEKWETEEIMKYDPDLIITYDTKDYDKLSKIAPVLVIPEGKMTSVERMKFLGQATGHEAEADKVISQFESKLSEAKEKLNSDIFKDKTFSIFEDWGSGSYGIYYETGSRGGTLIYDYLGLHKPEKLNTLVKNSGEGRGSLSYEVAAEYFGDYVLWFKQEGKESEYAKTKIWSSIPAVKNGHIIEIPAKYAGLFYYSDVASMTGQLDYIIGKLLEQTK